MAIDEYIVNISCKRKNYPLKTYIYMIYEDENPRNVKKIY